MCHVLNGKRTATAVVVLNVERKRTKEDGERGGGFRDNSIWHKILIRQL